MRRGFGLRIASAVPVPGTMAGAGTENPDIVVEYGRSPDWEAALVDGPYRATSPDRFDFTMPGLARYTCLDRRRVTIDAVPGADSDHVADMLIATALPALLWARGGIVLHAAAALFPGATAAVAVAGDSGSGKSTWLADAVAAGARVLADDSLHIVVEHGRIVASGLPGGYFRRHGPGEEDRTFTAVPPDRQVSAAPLGAVAILDRAASGPRPLSGAAAVAALLRHRHRPRISRLLGLEPAALAGIAAIARAVPLIEFSPGTSR